MLGFRKLGDRPLGLEPVRRALADPVDDQTVIAVEAAWLPLDDGGGPVIGGAAALGRVEAAGPSATQLVGQRVLLCQAVPCGECEVCRRGAGAACPAGHRLGRDRDGTVAEAVLARGRWLCPLEHGLELDPVAGALVAGPAALAYAMYARAGLGPGEPAAIIGVGATARALVRLAEAKGARAVAAGPDDPIAEVAARLAEAAGGERRPARLFDVGEPGGLALAAALAGPAATVVTACPASAAPLDVAVLAARAVTLVGVAGPHPDLLAELAALVTRRELVLDDLAEVVAFSALPDVAEAARRATATGRALIVTRAG